MKFLKNDYIVEEDLKKDYLKLVKELHPDNKGNEEDFKTLQNEYIEALKKVCNKHFNKNNEIYNTNINIDDDNFLNIINNLVIYNDLYIELIGSWVWITGNTKKHKEKIKALGCRFSKNKLCWYYHTGNYYKRNSENYTIENLRAKFGSIKVVYNELKKIERVA